MIATELKEKQSVGLVEPVEPVQAAEPAAAPAAKPLVLRVTDVTGQKKMAIRVAAGDTETTVGELIESLLPRMGLPAAADGRPLTYSARLEREGRHLEGSETLTVLREDDELMLSPSINAG